MRPLFLVLVALTACTPRSSARVGGSTTTTTDDDGDGATVEEDCDDTDPAAFPGNDDPVGDGLDANCDGIDGVDADGDGVASADSGGNDCDDTDPTVVGTDADGDGANSCVDCDDADPSVSPFLEELCNGVIDSCSGAIDVTPDGVGVCRASWDASGEVDVLFVVDDSCSMVEEQTALAYAAPIMMDVFLGSAIDYHMGVVTTDMLDADRSGRLVDIDGARWVDPSTVDPTGTMARMIQQGTSGSYDERGLEAAYRALDVEAAPGGFNDGFLRPGAHLDVIALSDEDDHVAVTPTDMADWLAGLATGGGIARFHSIVSPDPRCPTASEPGTAYMETSDLTGGFVVSICDQSSYVDLVVDVARSHDPSGADTFPLPVAVDPASLAADVDDGTGSIAHYDASQLTWNATELTVTLPAPVPAGGAVVIWYAPSP